MVLCEILQSVTYDQKLYVYVTNKYDQNMCIGRGERRELLDEDNCFDHGEDILFHLMDEVDLITIAKDNALVVRVTDKHYNERLENKFFEKYVKRWEREDPNSRPFLYSYEMEDSCLRR